MSSQGDSGFFHSEPLVYVVVLNWNNGEDTIACLESLAQLDYGSFRVVVIDNGSDDGSSAVIQAQLPEVEMIRLDVNTGYAEGNNIGIELALQREADYVLILNNDTLVAPDMLSELVRFAEVNTSAGIVGPRVICASESQELFALGSRIFWVKGQTRHIAMFEPSTSYSHLTDPKEVDFLAGCGVLVRRDLFRSGGLLDQTFFLNYEDVEFSVRARKMGYGSRLVPSAVMWHRISATLGQNLAANTYYTTRNSLNFFMAYGPKKTRWLAVGQILARTIRSTLAWSIKPKYRHDGFARRAAANLFAIRDFLLRRDGRMGEDVAEGIGIRRKSFSFQTGIRFLQTTVRNLGY